MARLFGFVTLVSVIALVACGDDTGTGTGGGGGGSTTGTGGGDGGSTTGTGGSGGADTQAVTVTFAAKVDGVAFACGTTYAGVGSGDTSGQLTDFRLYVHDFELLSATDATPVALDQDGVWQYEDVALLDFENKAGACANGTTEVNVTVRGTVPAGTTADGLRFKLGVPFALNHQASQSSPSPLNLSGLFWDWQGGHKFLRADFVPDGALGPFNLHLGSTGCDGDPDTGGTTACARENVTPITLSDFDVVADVVAVDYGAVLADTDLGAADAGGAPGCMSGVADPECAPIFTNLGIDISTGTLHPEMQKLFSVAP